MFLFVVKFTFEICQVYSIVASFIANKFLMPDLPNIISAALKSQPLLLPTLYPFLLHKDPNPFRPHLRHWYQILARHIHRVPLRLPELQVQLSKHIRQPNI